MNPGPELQFDEKDLFTSYFSDHINAMFNSYQT